jgi:hypothetical protein
MAIPLDCAGSGGASGGVAHSSVSSNVGSAASPVVLPPKRSRSRTSCDPQAPDACVWVTHAMRGSRYVMRRATGLSGSYAVADAMVVNAAAHAVSGAEAEAAGGAGVQSTHWTVSRAPCSSCFAHVCNHPHARTLLPSPTPPLPPPQPQIHCLLCCTAALGPMCQLRTLSCVARLGHHRR